MFSLTAKSDTHAIVLLKQDHRQVEKLFAEYERAREAAEKVRIVSAVCQALTVHTTIEETAFYPEALRALKGEDVELIREAKVEHDTLKELIARLDGMKPSEPLFKACVTVLKEYVEHHVKEEEKELFPKVEKTSLDLEAVGCQLADLKEQLESDLAQAAATTTPSTVSAPPLAKRPRRVSVTTRTRRQAPVRQRVQKKA